MRKVINPISKKTGGYYKHPVFISIEFENNKLSISGVEGPKKNGDAFGSCGQIDMSLREDDQAEWAYNPSWDSTMMDKLLLVWKLYHLNDMNPGCQHQRADNWSDQLVDNTKPKTQGNMLTWKTPKEHPDGLLTKPCPICGYKYGTEWLHEDVPEDIVKWLTGLPETTVTPAWV